MTLKITIFLTKLAVREPISNPAWFVIGKEIHAISVNQISEFSGFV
jgi:hypothetical protein